MAGLFRKEAIEYQSSRLDGDVLIALPLQTKLLSAFLLVVVLLVVLFVTFGSYARTETARGYIEPESGVAQVFAAQSGRISQVHIDEGSDVEAGQVLVTISDARYLVSGVSTQGVSLSELNGLVDEVRDLATLEKQNNENETERSREQLDSFRIEMLQLEKQSALSKKRIELLLNQVSNAEILLQDQHIAELELQNLKDALYGAQWESERLAQLIALTDSRIRDAELALEQLPLKLQQGISSLKSREAELILRRTEIQGEGTYSLTAPVSGRISGLYVKSGQHLDTNALVISVLPTGSEFQAVLYVPTRAIGFVEEGQDVRLFYDAFPHQRFGVQTGVVASVTSTVLTGAEVRVPTTISEPVYKISVDLDRQSVKAFGAEYALQSGMQVSAQIILESRSIMDWLLEPLYSLRGNL